MNMKTIEEITEAVAKQAQEYWERSNSHNWHSLILTSEGELYWSMEADQHSMSEAVYNGEDCRLCVFQGQTWNGADEDAYEMIEAKEELVADLNDQEKKCPNGGDYKGQDGEDYRRGDKSHGYDPEKWYRLGDLLSFHEAHDGVSEKEAMATAIEQAEIFWGEKED